MQLKLDMRTRIIKVDASAAKGFGLFTKAFSSNSDNLIATFDGGK